MGEPDDSTAGGWQEQAKCRGLNPNIFIPTTRGGSMDGAKSICNGSGNGDKPCPVRRECLEYAHATGSVGVWGGEMIASKNASSVSFMEEMVIERIANLMRETRRVRTEPVDPTIPDISRPA